MSFHKQEFHEKRQTRSQVLDNRLAELNELLGLKKGKYGNMIHAQRQYGGTTLSGHVGCQNDKSDYDGSCETDLGLYYIGRMSTVKITEIVNTMIACIEYAKRIK